MESRQYGRRTNKGKPKRKQVHLVPKQTLISPPQLQDVRAAARYQKAHGRLPPDTPDPVIAVLQNHERLLRSLAPPQRAGPTAGFGGIGHEVDKMIEHGQSAWSEIKKMLNVESKMNYAVAWNSSAVNYTAGSYDLTAQVTQGDGDTNRDGDSIKVQRVRCNYTITAAAAATLVRVTLIRSVAQAVTAATVITASGGVNAPIGFENWDARKNWVTHYSRLHTFTANTLSQSAEFECEINKDTLYEAAGTTVDTGAIQLLMVSNVNASTPTATAITELIYVDN